MDQPHLDVARDQQLGRLVADALDQLEKLGYSRRSLRRYRTIWQRLIAFAHQEALGDINGNSGSGKSSLINADLLPLIDQGWLWPRTSFECWQQIGPMTPGEHQDEMLAEHLVRAFGAEMTDVVERLDAGERGLTFWLRSRESENSTVFLLAIGQFEELCTLADPAQRKLFDRLFATALRAVGATRAAFSDQWPTMEDAYNTRNPMP